MIFKASLVNMPPLFSYFKGDVFQKMLLRTLSKYGFCIEILILKRILMKNVEEKQGKANRAEKRKEFACKVQMPEFLHRSLTTTQH